MPLMRGARALWLAAALAVSARAGVVRGPSPVFSAPGGAWAGPLGAAFADPAFSGLIPLALNPDLSSPEALRSASPLVAHIAHSLSLTPQKFAALSVAEKKAVIHLAADEAKDDLRAKVYELSEQARALSAPGKGLDREGRYELYSVVARLMEVRDHYGAWLDEHEAGMIEESYALASTRAWEARNSLIGEAGAPVGAKTAAAAVPVKTPVVLAPSGAAQQLRKQMEATKSGWGQNDLDALYTGYGFVLRQGGKHRFYYHPDFPQLTQSVSRQNDLPPGYAQSALKLIGELERLVAAQHDSAAAPASGPPATLTLADLSILLSAPKTKIPVVVYEKKRETPAAIPKRVEIKTDPDSVGKTRPTVEAHPLAVATRLDPPTERARENKPEPPPAQTAPSKSPGLVERLMILWRRLGG